MDQEDINYKTLRKIQQQEKTFPLLTKIDRNFYQKFSEYLKNLQRIAEKEENLQKIKLRKDDVLTLPKEMSEPLLKRGVVEQIK